MPMLILVIIISFLNFLILLVGTVLQKIKNAKRKPRILSIIHKVSEFVIENGINSTTAKLRKQKIHHGPSQKKK